MSQLLDILFSSADSTKPALTEVGKTTYSYEDLYQYSFQLKDYFVKKGISPGQRVMLLIEPGFQAVCCVLACLQQGICVILIDPETGEELFQSKLKTSKPDFILIDHRLALLSNHPLLRWLIQKVRPNLPTITNLKKNRLILNTRLPKFNSTENTIIKKSLIRNDQDALIIFTSGTTSQPKGVIHTHGSLAQSLKLISTLTSQKSGKFYTTQAYFLLFGLSLQAHVIFNPKIFSASQFIRDSNQYHPTLTFGPPGEFLPVVQYCQQHHLAFPSSYKEIFFGSAPITTSFLEKFYSIASPSLKTFCLYGMTEILPIAFVEGQQKLNSDVKGDFLGQLFPTVKTKLSKDNELIVSGSHLCKSYLNQHQHSEVQTGDLVKIKNGQLILSARKKDMILRRSFNIYPALYEDTIEKIPGVATACLIGIYDTKIEDEKVVLVIEPGTSKKLERNILMKQLKSGKWSIDTLALPDEIVFRSMPRFGRQRKIDKNKLRWELSR